VSRDCVAVCCSVLQRVAVCCSVLQCVAVWEECLENASRRFSKVSCTDILDGKLSSELTLRICTRCGGEVVPRSATAVGCIERVVARHCVLQCVAVCCSVLQCVAVCCSVLQLQCRRGA